MYFFLWKTQGTEVLMNVYKVVFEWVLQTHSWCTLGLWLKIPNFWRLKCPVTPFHFFQAKFWFKFIFHHSKRHILFISRQKNELIPTSKVHLRHPYMKIWALLVQVVNETLSINHLTAAFWKFSKSNYVDLEDKSDTKGQQNQGLNFVPFP